MHLCIRKQDEALFNQILRKQRIQLNPISKEILNPKPKNNLINYPGKNFKKSTILRKQKNLIISEKN